jgi:diguanylate cyclase (GGDEF)-like protein
LERLAARLPSGRPLPDELWNRRHRVIVVVLWLHAIGLAAFGLLMGQELLHVLAEVALIVLAAALAGAAGSRRWRASIASLGLITASAVLVHFSGGYIEMHFHFFVMLAVIMLYQDWVPFLLAVAYVALHHGTVGVLAPSAVFNHPAAVDNPWLWAGIHAVFVLAESLAFVASWQLADHQAVHDSTTGLASRTLFYAQVEHALARARLYGQSVSVVVLEVVNFEVLNSRLGRAGGDELLRVLAAQLRENLSITDTVARLGWATFAILTEDKRSLDEAHNLAARIRYLLRTPVVVNGQEVQITPSLGVAFTNTGQMDVDTLLQQAEAASDTARPAAIGQPMPGTDEWARPRR